MAGWRNPRWNSLRGPDAEALRAIFHDLEKFLDDPTFQSINLGEAGASPTVDVETGVVTEPPTTAVDKTTILDALEGGVPTVDVLPALPDEDAPAVVFLSTDGKLYRNRGDRWTSEVQASDVVGEIDPSQIPADAITANHIADFAVTAKKFNTSTHIIY